jgi:hypothetical protein
MRRKTEKDSSWKSPSDIPICVLFTKSWIMYLDCPVQFLLVIPLDLTTPDFTASNFQKNQATKMLEGLLVEPAQVGTAVLNMWIGSKD